MNGAPREAVDLNTRLLKCGLEVGHCRAYWSHAKGTAPPTAQQAFDEYWFGARSLRRTEAILASMRARFDAFPPALTVLHRWSRMPAEARRAICHWHLQLADPLYRRFTGAFLVERRAGTGSDLTRSVTTAWVATQAKSRWSLPTQIELASRLLSAAFAAGLVTSNRDPRPLSTPPIPAEALEYLLYLLRRIQFEGSLIENPYTASVGLEGSVLESRLRALPNLAFRRQGSLVDFGWRYDDLTSWAGAHLGTVESIVEEVAA